MTRNTLLIIVVLFVAGAAGFGISWWLNKPQVPETLVKLPEFQPDFSLLNMQGEKVSSTRWNGKPLLINFWATWCPPCREEIPLLKDLQSRYGDQGLQIIGIAVDEMDKVREYAATMQFNYPILVGQRDAVGVANQFGLDLYGLPVSVFVAADGRIMERHRGIISEQQAVALIEKLLKPKAPVNRPASRAGENPSQ